MRHAPEPDAPVSLAAQILELTRELGVRRRRYPQWIAAGTLQPDIASARLAALSAAIETIKGLAQPRLPLDTAGDPSQGRQTDGQFW